ncbi:serine/threonine-protein kinase [Streptomyces sp. V4-01]|uniref:mitogen-activated protein kinase kinase n=1 Tax=Actinacidiphila polyblastidii TaxID=3110430 RepID=A0ABU7PH22_9ACTN|nr:serine/threonine-protein kinase [Streptomyces sp. V4-01]
MDDHDGTGIPGEDNGTDGTAAQAATPAARKQPAQRKPATPAARPTASRGRKPQAASEVPDTSARSGTDAAEENAAATTAAAAPAADGAPVAPAAKRATAKTAGGKAAAPAAKKTSGAPAKKAAPSGAARATPAKATPAKSTAAKKTAAKATPAKTTPAKATPAKATPARTAAASKPAAAKKAPATSPAVAKTAVVAKTAKAAKSATSGAAARSTATSKAAGPRKAAAQGSADAWQAPGYVHDRDLGTGTNGRVVSALHEGSSVAVTITYLPAALAQDAAFRAEFRDDAQALGGVAAPYLAQLHAYVEDGPHAAIVREPVDGVALNALLGATGALPPEAALVVLKDSLLALHAAHEAGVLHRAYRPEHVLVTAEGVTKVVDFGVASRGEAVAAPAGPYTAPERSAGGPATVAADLYAATAVFDECLAGATPATVRPLVAWGLAAAPAERPESAADFAAELETAAVAAYGADWEERGRRELGALAASLPVADAVPQKQPVPALVPVPAPAPPAAPPAAAPGARAQRPRLGRRAKILAVAVAAAVVVAGAVAITAAASGSDGDPASAAPGATTPRTSGPAPTSPTAAATTASPPASASPSATATTTAPATGTASPTLAAADPTGTATGSATPTTTAPTTPASPTTTTGSAAAPHVASVAVTGLTCSTGGKRTAKATVLVQYDGTAAGTLHLTWWRSATGAPQGAVTQPAQTAVFPKGSQTYTFTDAFTFTADSARPYVGLTVSTDPGAASGNGSYRVGCH